MKNILLKIYYLLQILLINNTISMIDRNTEYTEIEKKFNDQNYEITDNDLEKLGEGYSTQDYTQEEKREIVEIIKINKCDLKSALQIYKATKMKDKFGKAYMYVYAGLGIYSACSGIIGPLINTYFSPYIQKYVNQKIFKNGLLPHKTESLFCNIAGYENIKKKCRKIIKKLKQQKQNKEYEKIDGILFYGEAGCGKTVFAQAIANEADIPLYIIKGTDLVNEQGQIEDRIDLLFNQINQFVSLNGPCILFLDEVDFVLKNRKNGNLNHNETLALQSFLNRLDGEIPLKGVLVICNTNEINSLDKALLRPGRIGELIEFSAPDQKVIIELVNLYSKKFKIFFENIESSSLFIANTLIGMNTSQIIKFLQELKETSIELNWNNVTQDNLEKFIDENNYYKI